MSKISIYQVFPRHFGNIFQVNKKNGTITENGCGKLNDFTPKALKSIKSLGITHIWYTGVIEHATRTDYSRWGIHKDHDALVKGMAGSPYAIKDYYDIDPDLAENVSERISEFSALVERTHKAGMKVIIDFVPNHVAREYHSDNCPPDVADLGEKDHPEWAFSPLNNFYYLPGQPFNPQFDIRGYTEFPAKATGNDQFTASPSINDWYETVKLNYGINYFDGRQKQFDPIPDTWTKMLDILLFWAAKKVDGFRCDMAEMVPVEFWRWVIAKVKEKYPECIFIAEVYNPSEYRNFLVNGRFDYLYDKVGLYDTLRNIMTRNHPARHITDVWQSLGGIQDQMLNFLENHDEQRIASGFFSGDGMSAIPALIVSAMLTNAPFMIYSGQELGETGMDMEGFSGLDGRTSIFDYWSVKSLFDWNNQGKFDEVMLTSDQKKLRGFYKKLLNLTISEKPFSYGLMYDLEYANFENREFNTNKEYAFLRKYEDEIMLVVVNFHDQMLDTDVNIPFEAFQYLDMKENATYLCKSMLDDETGTEVVLSSGVPFKTRIPAWNGKIYKLKQM